MVASTVRPIPVAAALAGAFLGMSIGMSSSPLRAQTLNDNRLRLETWSSGYSQPTTFAWIGPGELFLFEKATGRVKWVKDGVFQKTVLNLDVSNDSERGGLGIAADPDFATNKHVFVYYSATDQGHDGAGSWTANRVDRFEWDGSNLVNQFGPIVAFPMDASQANGANHDGGVIKFGPDGKLYGQTGDLNRGRFGGGDERIEQNTSTTGSASVGGIFRLNPDGTIPSDNPFVGETDTDVHLWWSYGLRNGFGMDWDPRNGNLWNTENGPNVYDEVCRVPKGFNSGWLKIMGPDSRNASYGENGNANFDAPSLTYLQNAVYLDPELSFLSPVGITALGFIASNRFPEDLQDDVLLGDNNLGNVYYADMASSRTAFVLTGNLADKVADTTSERNKLRFGTGFSVVTDIQVGADGYLYLANLGTGTILRVRPVTDLVEPAAFTADGGTAARGPVDNLETSDDARLRLEPSAPVAVMPSVGGTAAFELTQTDPTDINLIVEAGAATRGCTQRILVRNQTNSQFELLDSRPASLSETSIQLDLGGSPEDYVSAGRTVEVRYELAESLQLPFGPPRQFSARLDQMRLEVTYP